MSNRALAEGLFRAWGLVWAVDVLIGVPQFVNSLLRNPYGPDESGMRHAVLSSQAISVGCTIAVAVFLVTKANWLASIVFPVEQELGLAIGAADFRAALFSAVGLYFLIDGTKQLVASGYLLISRPRGNDQNAVAYMWQRQPEQLVMAVAEVVAGGLVLFGRGRLLHPGQLVRRGYQKLFGLRDSADE